MSSDHDELPDDYLIDDYLQEGHLQEPEVLRVIDIETTCSLEEVVLLDFWEQQLPRGAYTAVSHTYGMEVYEVFNCRCTAKFSSEQVPPRCSLKEPCLHETPGEAMDQRNRVVGDILRMCGILRKAGVKYAWHDGVCIAQHDGREVNATIKSMGWIYFMARETIVFLHYVGRPMAPIAPRGSSLYELTCRWHTRVWTVQEAALSRRRRYCVRVCSAGGGDSNFSFSPGECRNPEEFEQKVHEVEGKICLWYRDESSRVDVISEKTFYDILEGLYKALEALSLEAERLHINSESSACIDNWFNSVKVFSFFLSFIMFDSFLTNPLHFRAALHQCRLRDSKHMGDRINSILGLAMVHDFVVPKDDLPGMEAWTMKFFENVQVEPGLALAVFSVNPSLEWSDREFMRHSWVPVLYRPLELEINPDLEEGGISFSVREEDGKLELRGPLMCVAVKFTLQIQDSVSQSFNNINASSEAHLMHVYDNLMVKDAQQLGMHLIFFPQSRTIFLKAVLPLAPTCYMGGAVFPIFKCEDGERCLDIGGEFVKIRDGESFQACLVFPLLSNADDCPTLVVRQQLPQHRCHQAAMDLHNIADGHVFKLGTFRMTKLLKRIALDPAHPASTIIKELVII